MFTAPGRQSRNCAKFNAGQLAETRRQFPRKNDLSRLCQSQCTLRHGLIETCCSRWMDQYRGSFALARPAREKLEDRTLYAFCRNQRVQRVVTDGGEHHPGLVRARADVSGGEGTGRVQSGERRQRPGERSTVGH